MPELPEVQTIVDDLIAAGLVGKTITSAKVFWPRTIAEPTANDFTRRIRGQQIGHIHRRAKFIIFRLHKGLDLLIHLRMTGRLELSSRRTPRNPHHHVWFNLNNRQQLRFQDTRKFGRIYLIESASTFLAHLGPEPLDRRFSAAEFCRRLHLHQRMLKPLLLDQRFVAGLGNIYVDEALWEAGIHPMRKSNRLNLREVKRLHRAIRKVLRRGLRNLGTTLGTGKTTFYSIAHNRGRNREALQVFRQHGRPCPRCHNPIDRIVVGQRGTHICRACQIEDIP
jgi:formamidopyrimidine-DNA glycosylase